MLFLWGNDEGVVYLDLLEYGRTVNCKLYKEQLTKVHENFKVVFIRWLIENE